MTIPEKMERTVGNALIAILTYSLNPRIVEPKRVASKAGNQVLNEVQRHLSIKHHGDVSMISRDSLASKEWNTTDILVSAGASFVS